MATSQNGWSAGNTAQIGGLDNSYVPGTKVKLAPGVRNGDVATVLFYVAEQFHQHVEPLHSGWCWGYNYRKIEGSSSLSNHSSGTAIDLNAPNHPMGAHGTFSEAKVTAIRTILAFCEGVVRWGGDYSGRKDEMHFEIHSTSAQVARIATKIRGGQASTPPAPTKPSTWKPNLTVDGKLGPDTIRAWQHIMGTPQDGKISNPSDLVKAVQRRLNTHGAKLTVDGKGIAQNGKQTNTIRALQRYLGVPVDGEISTGKSATIVALQKRLNSVTF